jgi:hypothetical protein
MNDANLGELARVLQPLSPRQRDMVAFVARYTRVKGYSPSMADAARELGVTRQHAQRIAGEAAARGALLRDPGTARSWRVVALDVPILAKTNKRG